MRTLVIALGVICAGVAWSGSVQAATPSFLCAKAKTWVEQTICGSETLSTLDLDLAVAYARMLKVTRGTARKSLEAEQQAWWNRRSECRKHSDPVACLEDRHRHQIAALESRPDYPGDAPAKTIELEPEPITTAGRGWTRDLSRYLRAIRACSEESPVPVGKVLVAWGSAEAASVFMRLVDWNGKEWVCSAHADGHKVFRFGERDAEDDLPASGPVFHLSGSKAPPNCKAATQVLDANGKAAGWISATDC